MHTVQYSSRDLYHEELGSTCKGAKHDSERLQWLHVEVQALFKCCTMFEGTTCTKESLHPFPSAAIRFFSLIVYPLLILFLAVSVPLVGVCCFWPIES